MKHIIAMKQQSKVNKYCVCVCEREREREREREGERDTGKNQNFRKFQEHTTETTFEPKN